ncbi:glycosyltransferase [Jiella sp. MQZ9-1]|nr:glycosyltransferase [Jiella flava]MCD2471680.1 glycosyltransferase [Jiella flava]
MRISVALATYNGARYLEPQLESLAGQTHLPAELVVGDDGSSDATIEILERFARVAPFPVRISQNPTNRGHGQNFLETASRCRGDWIAFCDQDDIWSTEKLKRFQHASIRRPQLDWMVCRNRYVDDRLRTMRRATLALSERGNWMPLTSPVRIHDGHRMIFRRWFVDLPWQRRPVSTDGRLITHDRWLSVIGYLFGHRHFLRDRLTLYRQHQGSVTMQAKAAERSVAVGHRLDARRDFFAERDRFWSAMEHWCLSLPMDSCAKDEASAATAARQCRQIAQFYRDRARVCDRTLDRQRRVSAYGVLVQRSGTYAAVFGQPPLIRDLFALMGTP